ncbi:MAG TPA: Rieske 2Fe-2S domain-containing protein [Myxococcus sp.]|nr:Rieske 2Fe-2S domain-containing protein [Myxococcus sp.]
MQDYRKYVVERPAEGRLDLDWSIFTEEAIFDEEMRRIFEGTWVYLAHESQFPNPGDFVTAPLGRQPVIVTRNKSGEVRAFINACAHRGAALCRTPSGSCATFVCSYHGWSYDLDGQNIGVKEKNAGGYPPSFDDRPRGLTPLARVASYRGFVFGSLSPAVPSLEEHLGDARVFIDLLVDPAPQGLEVVRGAATYAYDGNWKVGVENSVDAYHFSSVHATFVRIAMGRRPESTGKPAQMDAAGAASGRGGGYDLGNGHVMVWSVIPNPQVLPLYARRGELVERFGQVRADWMIGRLRNVVIYPNLMLMYQVGSQIRVARPVSASRTEVATWCLAPVGEEPALRARRVSQYADFYGASGVGTPDDLAEFNACQQGYAGRAVGRHILDRGGTRLVAGADEEARALGINPVASSPQFADETAFFGMYREWARLMSRGGNHER